MKAIKFSLVAALAVVMMLTTSCLNQDNEAEFTRFGIIKNNSEGLSLFYYSNDTSYELPVYIPGVSKENSTYVYARTKINYDNDQNKGNTARVRGYYIGDKLEIYQDNIESTETQSLNTANSDKKLKNEVVIGGIAEGNFLQNTLMLNLSITHPQNSTMSYLFEFDPYQEPTQETPNGLKVNVYDLYLRAIASNSGVTPMLKTYSHAFPINSSYIDYLSGNSENKETGGFYLRLNFVTSIDNDTQEVKWNKNYYITIPVYDYNY